MKAFTREGVESTARACAMHFPNGIPTVPKVTLKDALQQAFDKAESEVAAQFNGKTCSIEDKDGKHNCPICFFRRKVREHLVELGFDVLLPFHAQGGASPPEE